MTFAHLVYYIISPYIKEICYAAFHFVETKKGSPISMQFIQYLDYNFQGKICFPLEKLSILGILLNSVQEMIVADPIRKYHVRASEGREIVHATEIRRDSRNPRENVRTISRQQGEITCVLQPVIDGLKPVKDVHRSAVQVLPDVAETVAGSMGAYVAHVGLCSMIVVVPVKWNIYDCGPVETGIFVGPSMHQD